MTLFLMVVFLLSIFVGYCHTFACWTRKLLLGAELPHSVRGVVHPKKGRAAYCTAGVLSAASIGFGFWSYGLLPGAAIGFSFLAVSRVTHLVLRRRINNLFHLNLVLRSLTQHHLDCLYRQDLVGATAIDGLIEKVTRELYAIKAVKSAELVPIYEGSTVYLSINGAKADNYHCSYQGSSRQR